ncbi:4Fe-4S dicluster domain-containing protein [Mesoterricola sediminis]|uniref:4Fe-4S ferredoxin n=1 Tax=Mesoterricola sediminis TaxID=2927980 RepID=A0AA48KCP7_9BACT|nr:4Fe-4S dicluster domain-containing protein [Mesoterricola sediminis]BDU77359.1 4Fe-4S ferredoxin [Mesoterricola sediminis]
MPKNPTRRYIMVLDSRKCIDCKACVVACKAENRVPLGRFRNWINAEREGAFPRLRASFDPEQCHHCENPSCVRVCPTGASWQREDGIVMVREADCIGCKYCMVACPYGARFFNEETKVVDKCTFCAHRVDRGEVPACVETCPSRVRTFGDAADPKSPVHALLEGRRYRVLKPQTGNGPQLYYLL